MDKIGNAEFITTLDLTKGYCIGMHPEERAKTAFTSPRGLYQFVTMHFGLSGASATFQRKMDGILRGTESFASVSLYTVIVGRINSDT